MRLELGQEVPANYREKPNRTFTHLLANHFDQVIWGEMQRHQKYIDSVGWDKPRLALRAINEINALEEEARQFLVRILNGTVPNR
jgi:hypothetical protein